MNTIQNYIKGKFIGTYETKCNNTVGYYNYSDIHWSYLKIENLEVIKDFDVYENKTGNFWFKEVIKQKSKFNFYRKTTDVFIPKGEKEFYSGNLYNVIIKNIEFKNDGINFKTHQFVEASGDIYFQLEKKKDIFPTKKNKTENKTGTTGSGVNIDTSGQKWIDEDNKNEDKGKNPQPGKIVGPNPEPPKPGILNESNSKWLFNLLGVLFWIGFLIFCWNSFPSLFYIFLAISIGWLLTRFFGKSFLGKIFSFILILLLFGMALRYFSKQGEEFVPKEKKDGNIKISPPIKKDPLDGSNNKDFTTEKEIQWYDFINHQYIAKYATSSLLFFESQKTGAALAKNGNPANTISYFNGLYSGMVQNDNPKIKEIVTQFSEKARSKNLNQLETAEMVTTFVQEIPYYLIHDYTCEQVITKSNSSFISDYHKDGRPCLPNVPGGVQSPYEFLHNLKGDCDTRSLLAFALLKELGISASVWVSEAYGHSILGVGLPFTGGVNKTIDGINHYGVELTAKGYRIGMISPDHNNMSNWDIALSYNHH